MLDLCSCKIIKLCLFLESVTSASHLSVAGKKTVCFDNRV